MIVVLSTLMDGHQSLMIDDHFLMAVLSEVMAVLQKVMNGHHFLMNVLSDLMDVHQKLMTDDQTLMNCGEAGMVQVSGGEPFLLLGLSPEPAKATSLSIWTMLWNITDVSCGGWVWARGD